MKNIFTTLISLFALSVMGQAQYSRVKIDLTEKAISELSVKGIETDHGKYVKGKYFLTDLSEHEIEELISDGFDVEVIIDDVKAHYKNQNKNGHEHYHEAEATVRNSTPCNSNTTSDLYDYETPVNYTDGSMGGYFTYEEMLSIIDDMREKYPNLISAKDTIENMQTHENRPIYWLRVSNTPDLDNDNPEILYTALHHAREANSLSQMIYYLWYLLENYETNDEVKYLIDHTEMYFIPCVNPDGYIWNQTTDPTGGGLWRKNRYVDTSGTVTGVDLNRNYGFGWGVDDGGSSPNAEAETYRGVSAFSEPETQAVRNFANQHEFQIALNYHSYGNLLIHPWGYNDTATSEDATFKGMAEILTEENAFSAGTVIETVGYQVNGNSDDWMYGDEESKPKIYAMTPEVGEAEFGFWPPMTEIDRLNKSVLLQNLRTAHLVHSYADISDDSSMNIFQESGSLPLTITNCGLAKGDIRINVSAANTDLEIDFEEQIISLDHLEKIALNVDYQVLANDSKELKFIVEVSNGNYTYEKEIIKNYFKGDYQLWYTNSADDINQWTVIGNWDTTTSSFVSAPSSITDSPDSQYESNSTVSIQLLDTVDLTYATDAILRFNAQWDIEEGFDYAQLLIGAVGEDMQPQCGSHTTIGNVNQDEGQPLYDGTQEEWINEEINLSEYVGKKINIGFRLLSDPFVIGDGFSFDDIEVYAVNSPSSIVENEIFFDFSLFPNPTTDQLTIAFDLPDAQTDVLANIYNQIGDNVRSITLGSRVSGKHNVNILLDDLSTGMYFLQLISDKDISNTQSFIIE